MTSLRTARRLAIPLIVALVTGFATMLVSAAPASAALVVQGITGTVTDAGGVPLQGIDVYFLQNQPGGGITLADVATTGADGGYADQLPEGSYVVGFFDGAGDHVTEFWDDVTAFDDATPVSVTALTVRSHIDATLATSGHITGHIEGSDGAPVVGALVDVYTFDGQQWGYAPAGADTDANGDYDVVVSPGTYRLEFYADGYTGEFYDDVATVEQGTSITVADGATESGKDAVLEKGASLSGAVTLPSDAGVDDLARLVTVIDTQTGDPVAYAWLDPSTETAPGSRTYPWSATGLHAGSYRVEFGLEEGASTTEGEFYDDHPESAGVGSAETIQLANGEDRTGIDAALRTGGTISGTVVDGNGDPIADCEVYGVNTYDHYVTRVGTTASDGTFVVTGLTTGQYAVVVGGQYANAPCTSAEYYTNPSGDLSPEAKGITPVATAPGTNNALPVTLVYQGTLPTAASTAPPTVPAGAPVVGTAVTADPGTWDPADATLTYQWKANGVAIGGATSLSYTPVSGDIGKKLSVTITGSKSGYNAGTATSSETAPVVAATATAPTIQNFAPPSVSGTARVGSVLAGERGTWTDGASLSLQWLRDGVPVAGATGTTYALGAADVGARLSLRVTATKDGAQPETRTSAATEPVQLGVLTLASLPQLLGQLHVGKILRAVPQTTSPAGTAVRYRWLRNGVPIKGRAATQARYQLVAADRGKHISVRITVLRPGYASYVTVATKRGKVR